ncbi:spore coat polysaccharide biosynthesis protein spsF [Aquipluma nitroreducens]|uniref:Spore coat polysaccharide biosynthesis protein spsF n=1 Tax=Aquipluma nitroreducens TaxID=2010828 RepID=A0A5K7S4E4_9BACT|nr:hypothetical protein [Aquipluma nitroreducens]BBE16224.1 spore coat polysaccharide biosynthesis protein spsF [Aquipluma nitroreducens]
MKIGLFITARLKSSRLPLKLLLDLNGRTIIERVIDRAKQITDVDQIVLCTSVNRQDKPLTDIALKNDIHYYLGSEEDVLQRLLDAAKFFSVDYIISITGENPIFSVEYANQTIDLIKKTHADFIQFAGLPIGCAVYGIKVKALEVVCAVKKEVDTEIWGPLINRPELFDIIREEVPSFYNRLDLRITNDYFEDYQFLNAVFKHFGKNEIPSLYSVLDLLDLNPEYLKIHGHRIQASLSEEQLGKIDIYFKENLVRIKEIKAGIYKKMI